MSTMRVDRLFKVIQVSKNRFDSIVSEFPGTFHRSGRLPEPSCGAISGFCKKQQFYHLLIKN